MPTSKPLWLILAPVIFLLLWSGGFSVAKLGIQHAEPLSFLAVRYSPHLKPIPDIGQSTAHP